MKKLRTTKIEKLCIAIAIVYSILAVLFVRSIPAQVIKPMDAANVGDVVYRKGTTEIKKATNNRLHAKIYSSPQWDANGKSLLTYDLQSDKATVRGRYVKYVPDTATAKLQCTTITGNSSIKEYWFVPDDKTKSLSWTIDTDAPAYEYEDGKITYRDSQGELLFITEKPYAWDAKHNVVPLKTTYQSGKLTYEIQGTGYTYPLTIDPLLTLAATNDQTLYAGGADYATGRDKETADGAITTQISVGQNPVGHTVYRSFLTFALPSIHEVLAETLYVDGKSDVSTTDFGIYIHTSTYSTPIATTDYDLFNGRKAGTSHTGAILNNTWNSSSYSAGWNAIVFNAAGLDTTEVHRDGAFKIALISKEDYDNSDPGGVTEYIDFENSTASGKEPYLSLLYVPPLALTRTMIYDKNPNMIWNNGEPIYIWKP